MTDIIVRLTWAETMQAASIGVMRLVQNLKMGRNSGRVEDDHNWGPHIEGACGEMAVAKHFGLFWSGAIGNIGADDVGRLQVRTRSKHDYELILHKEDRDDRKFILLTGIAPEYRVRGWITAIDGKLPEYWKTIPPHTRPPAYFVPHSKLRPIEELIALEAGPAAA